MSNAHHQESSDFLTRQQLAARWNCHPVTIYRWEKSGRLTPQRLGPRTIRYPIEYVEQVEKQRITNQPESE